MVQDGLSLLLVSVRLQGRRRDEGDLKLFKLQVVGGPRYASPELSHAADDVAHGVVEGAADAGKAEVGLEMVRPVPLLAHHLFQLLLVRVRLPGMGLLPGADSRRRRSFAVGRRGGRADPRQGGVLGGRGRENFLGLLLLLRVELVPDVVHVLRERREIRDVVNGPSVVQV